MSSGGTWWLFGGAAAPEHSSAVTTDSDGRLLLGENGFGQRLKMGLGISQQTQYISKSYLKSTKRTRLEYSLALNTASVSSSSDASNWLKMGQVVLTVLLAENGLGGFNCNAGWEWASFPKPKCDISKHLKEAETFNV